MIIGKEGLLQEILKIQKQEGKVLLAIDGRCAAGKTTLATQLQKELNCNVIPVDHFFLRPEQRTEERLSEPGGNVDYERFLEEVLEPVRREKNISYRPFDCHTMTLKDAVNVATEETPITIIEGSYSCHPRFWNYYNMHLFMTTDSETQIQRIRMRNGEQSAVVFREKWIPLEEKYFSECHIEEKCEFVMHT